MFTDPVPADYVHVPKAALPGEELVVSSLRFKWYQLRQLRQLRQLDFVISESLERESRAQIAGDAASGAVDFGSTMGFVILHIAGKWAMLLTQTWRNANEIWETVYLKDLSTDAAYEVYQRRGHLATFCVWELVIVAHERTAFERYLFSKRDAAAKEIYFADRYQGPAQLIFSGLTG